MKLLSKKTLCAAVFGAGLLGVVGIGALAHRYGWHDVPDKLRGISAQLQIPFRSLVETDNEFFLPSRHYQERSGTSIDLDGNFSILSWNLQEGKNSRAVASRLSTVVRNNPDLGVLAFQESPDLKHPIWQYPELQDILTPYHGVYAPDVYYNVDTSLPFNEQRRTRTVGNSLFVKASFAYDILDLPRRSWSYHGEKVFIHRNAIVLTTGPYTFMNAHTEFFTSHECAHEQLSTILPLLPDDNAFLIGDLNLWQLLYGVNTTALDRLDESGFYDPWQNLRGRTGFQDFILSRNPHYVGTVISTTESDHDIRIVRKVK